MRARPARARTPASSTRSRTSSTSGSPPSSCCRSSRSTASRRRPAWSTTGATSRSSFFAPHAGVRQPAGPDGRRRRVPRPGQGAPPGRHRGHPRRRLQPHRRGRRGRPDVLRSAASPTTTTTCSTATGGYIDYSGTGNTFNANRPIVRRLILDSLRYWVAGDARRRLPVRPRRGPVARRGTASRWPTRRRCGTSRRDPVLAGTKLIAEAWDAGGLYQVGSFVGDRWVEWNGRFRDDVRSFVKGDRGHGPGGHAAVPRQPGHLRPQASRAAGERQLRHLPRRLHAQRPRLLRRASTTRRTARTTATATTRT